MALLGVVGGIITAVPGIPSLIGGSDPAADAERKARIDLAFSDAMAGRSVTIWKGQSYPAAQCLHDMANDPNNAVCGVGSTVAKTYAKVKWAEYTARSTAGKVGVALVGQSTIPARIQAALSDWTTLLLVGVVVVGGIWYFTRK